MTRIDVYLKGGAVVPLDVESFTVTTSSITNTITKLTWKGAKSNPLYISPDDVSAVVER